MTDRVWKMCPALSVAGNLKRQEKRRGKKSHEWHRHQQKGQWWNNNNNQEECNEMKMNAQYKEPTHQRIHSF